MSSRETVYDGTLFRLTQQAVPHKKTPYEFVQRIGAVTVLPITHSEQGEPLALTIVNQRYHYGTSHGLPAGNMGGGFDQPEDPGHTGLRELREEAGYGYPAGQQSDIEVFRMRPFSSTITYPSFFMVARNVSPIGGEVNCDHEKITLQPTPLQEYVDPLFSLQRGETFPEVNAAFAKAGMELDRDAVMQWLVNPNDELTQQVHRSFEPWLLAQNT